VLINEEEEYEVEEVWKHRTRGQGTQYLVHWKGYGDEHNQWIAESGLPHTKQAIEDYWTRCSKSKPIKRGVKSHFNSPRNHSNS